MTYNSEIHHRRSIRLRGYDYSQNGAYFLTICTHNHECLFGEISTDTVGARSVTRPDYAVTRPDYNPAHLSKPCHQPEPARIMLNDFGIILNFTWYDLPNHNKNVVLDAFVIMPNHIHGIVVIADDEAGHGTRAGLEKRAGHGINRAGHGPAPTVSEIVRQLKTFSAKRINHIRQTPGRQVWQRNYFERIIRNDEELNRTRQYIIDNPMNWKQDENYI